MTLDEHEIGNRDCKFCKDDVFAREPEECWYSDDCKGLMHFEFEGSEYCEETSDSWYTYEHRCDVCKQGYPQD